MDAECALRPGGCPDSEVKLLRERYPYDLAQQREAYSPDGKSRLLVRLETQTGTDGQVGNVPKVMIEESAYDSIRRLSPFTGGAYDPVWSPNGDRIAMVSTDPGNDEIYVMDPDGADVRRLTSNIWEWDKHPTWSPDGSRILFYSNRDSGQRQLWMTDADGGNQVNVSNNQYEDWDPVWIK